MKSPRNQPHALVDCACETTVYQDGSGVEIHYCPMHDAAPDLLKALTLYVDHFGDPLKVARPAIAKAGGQDS